MQIDTKFLSFNPLETSGSRIFYHAIQKVQNKAGIDRLATETQRPNYRQSNAINGYLARLARKYHLTTEVTYDISL